MKNTRANICPLPDYVYSKLFPKNQLCIAFHDISLQNVEPHLKGSVVYPSSVSNASDCTPTSPQTKRRGSSICWNIELSLNYVWFESRLRLAFNTVSVFKDGSLDQVEHTCC